VLSRFDKKMYETSKTLTKLKQFLTTSRNTQRANVNFDFNMQMNLHLQEKFEKRFFVITSYITDALGYLLPTIQLELYFDFFTE